MSSNPGRSVAPHVQAAMKLGQAVGQPKAARIVGGGRPVVAHLQAAVSQARVKDIRPPGAGPHVNTHVPAGSLAKAAQAKPYSSVAPGASSANTANCHRVTGKVVQRMKIDIYESFHQFVIDGKTYHINWQGGGTHKKSGKEIYHVTSEKSPKQHYYFYIGDDTKAVSCREGNGVKDKHGHMFSALPQKVQDYVNNNL